MSLGSQFSPATTAAVLQSPVVARKESSCPFDLLPNWPLVNTDLSVTAVFHC